MKQHTQTTLALYVIALMEEGFESLHVAEVIPTARINQSPSIREGTWSQFAELESLALALLADANITYHQPSGWFRKTTKE